MVKRRTFLKSAGAMALAGAVAAEEAAAQPYRGTLKKSLYYSMLPKELSVEDKFMLAKSVDFDGIEVPTLETQAEVAEFAAASKKAGLPIHSIMNSRHWKYPFSSPDAETVKMGMEGMEMSLRNAKALGAEVVLLVPGVVNAATSYSDCYTRSQKHIRELMPLAEELKIAVGIENVWNKFLLSPLEFAKYVDEIDSPYFRAYFDCGNIALYGFPHDWIRTLGKRTVRFHIKGFNVKEKTFTNILDGTIDWKEVRKAISDIGYSGWVNAELGGGDEAYLRDVAVRMDKIFRGET